MQDQQYRDELEHIQTTRGYYLQLLLKYAGEANQEFDADTAVEAADKLTNWTLGIDPADLTTINSAKELNKLRESQRDMDKKTSEAQANRWPKPEGVQQ